MFLVSLFFISNALYLTPSTFCYNMMRIMYSYFDIMYAYYRAAIIYNIIQYSFTFVVVPKLCYLTLYVYIYIFTDISWQMIF